MLFDSIELLNTAKADNLSIISGNTFPTGSIGELFNKTGTDEGLYYHDGTQWMQFATELSGVGEGIVIETGATYPATPYAGQLFIKTGVDANTYSYNGETWIALTIPVIPPPGGGGGEEPSVPGNLWTWGVNNWGQLGLGYVTSGGWYPPPVDIPEQITTIGTVSKMAMGPLNGAAIKSDGTLWTWGGAWYGALGDGTNEYNDTSVPGQVGLNTDWKDVKMIEYSVLALKTDGTLWSWGDNTYGQLGDGTTVNKSSPIQIGSGTNWAQICTSRFSSFAIKTDGTLWTWGDNSIGYLGDGTIIPKSSPVQVGSLTDWKNISIVDSSVLALKTNGTIWSWGANYSGQLGLGDTTHRSSPVQIGTSTDWKYVSCNTSASFAIKTDGTLWSWGDNQYGQLGTINVGFGDQWRSSPLQVGALTDWKSVQCKGFAGVGLKTDGTLWGWGDNSHGVLGEGIYSTVFSPMQITSYTNWVSFETGQTGIMGLRA